MAKQTINYGTPPAGADGDTVPAALAKMESNFTELYGRIVGKGYINGLQMKWVSATALTLGSGAAYIQGTGTVLSVDSDIAKTGLSLTASTWYHAYVYDNAGTPDFVLSTTAPATAYNGTARSMTGDTSKRYVGSVKTDASGGIYNFLHLGKNIIRYVTNNAATPFLIVSGGAATTPTSVSCSEIVPITSRLVISTSKNNDTSGSVLLTTSDSGFTMTSTTFSDNIPLGSGVSGYITLDASQAFLYMYSGTPAGSWVSRASGYVFDR